MLEREYQLDHKKMIKSDVRPETVSIIKSFKPENITAEILDIKKEKKLA